MIKIDTWKLDLRENNLCFSVLFLVRSFILSKFVPLSPPQL